MRKVLILAYDFPPLNSIGAQRPYSWFKYFNEFDIYPIVVTRLWDVEINSPIGFHKPSIGRITVMNSDENGTIIQTPFNPNLRDRLITKSGVFARLLRKLLSLLQVFTEHHFSIFSNKNEIYDEALKYLKSNPVDLIIASGEPFVLFSYAKRLSNEFNIPWVADYRDGWSTNNNLESTSLLNKFISRYFQLVEKSVVKSATFVTTAAPDFSLRIANLLNWNTTRVPVIYNGYFEEMYFSTDDVSLNADFTIVHAGTIYPFQRLETFLRGLKMFRSKHPEKPISTVFYGLNMFPDQMERIQQEFKADEIEFTDKLPHAEIIEKLKSSHIQLLLATPEVNQIYAKVFDYLATGRPILMVENDKGPLEEILSNRPNAKACSSAQEVCEYLEAVYDNPVIKASTKTEDNTFTRRNQTKRFAELIHQTIESEQK